LARYRLRFLLQEIDVHRGITLIGRSPDCQVTIEDPLVSRQHARITIDDTGAHVDDLKSRNGVKVNNQPIKGPTAIKDGDRLRIGTQELVFCELAEGSGPVAAKTTGFLRHCSRCRMPYPQELLACPSCGETMQLEEDTMTGQLGGDTSRSWGLQLLLEVLDKALALGRVPDAVRALQRIEAQIEERLAVAERVEPKQLDEIARSACTLASATRDPRNVTWVLHVYPRAKVVPSASAIEALAAIAVSLRSEMRPAVEALIDWVRLAQNEPAAAASLKKLEQVAAAIEAADARGDPDQTSRNPVLS
jgi:FHA domain